ncbi:regulatory protein, luxR family [Glycomyces sambucus]|uniref:Regulatory protein, luxR family n=1 Tax=Glycomyces sambucus TaxID=380244 RepID=A0A1G9D8Y4_9ACTN|nr:LuxR family transcriptional regulator [Glycomyces sambucus]SDK60194.1 regulatory protein, luxR family [Glycomyces sambucus]
MGRRAPEHPARAAPPARRTGPPQAGPEPHAPPSDRAARPGVHTPAVGAPLADRRPLAATLRRLDDGSLALVVTAADAHLLHEATRADTTVTLRVANGGTEHAARAALARGRRTLADGPLGDAYASFTLAGVLAAGAVPALALAAYTAAADTAWAAGDRAACTAALESALAAMSAPTRPLAAPSNTAPSDPPGTIKAGATPKPSNGHLHLRPNLSDPSGTIEMGGPPGARFEGNRPDTPDTQLADYLWGLAALLRESPAEAIASLRRVAAFAGDSPDALHRASAAALILGDTDDACRIGLRALAIARDRDRPDLTARALEYLAYAEMRAGRHARARTHAREGLDEALRTGRANTAAHHRAVLALSASVAGDTAEVEAHANAALDTARHCGLGQTGALAEWALARSDLARGAPDAAAARLAGLVSQGHFGVRHLLLPCFAEAAALAGREQEAQAAARELKLWAASGLDRAAQAQLARVEALTAAPGTPPEAIDALYLRAIRLHPNGSGDFERARTQLHHGKWLRRRRRPLLARAVLREALHGFERCGAALWAEQARQELRATGEQRAAGERRGPATGALAALTPHQLRIARLVATGATNREVARSLSLSVRTVDHHLRNIFASLGVRSRVELARLVADTA